MQQNVYTKLNTTYLKCPGSTIAPIQSEYNPTLFASNVNIDNVPLSLQTELTHRDLTVYQTCINKVYNFASGPDNMQTLLKDISNSYIPILPPNGIRFKAIKDAEIILDASYALLVAYDSSYSRLTNRISTNKTTFTSNLNKNSDSLTKISTYGGVITTQYSDLTNTAIDMNSFLSSNFRHFNFAENMFNAFRDTTNIDTLHTNLNNTLISIKFYRSLYMKITNIYSNYRLENTAYDAITNDYISYINNRNSNSSDLKSPLSKNTTLSSRYVSVLSTLNSLKSIKNTYNTNNDKCITYNNRYTLLNSNFLNCYKDSHIDKARSQYNTDTDDFKSAKKNKKSQSTIDAKQSTRQSSLDCYNALGTSLSHYNSRSHWNKSNAKTTTDKGKNIYDNYYTGETVRIKVFNEADWKDQTIYNSVFNTRNNLLLQKCSPEISDTCKDKSVLTAYNYIKNNTDSNACSSLESSKTSFNTNLNTLNTMRTTILLDIINLMKTMGIPETSSLMNIPSGDYFNSDTNFNNFYTNLTNYINKNKSLFTQLKNNKAYITNTFEPISKEFIRNNCTDKNEVVVTYTDYNNTTFKGLYNITLEHTVTFVTDKILYLLIAKELPIINTNGPHVTLYNTICADIIEANRIRGLFNDLLIKFNTRYTDYTNNLIFNYDKDVSSYNTKISTAIASFNNCAYLKTCDRPVTNPESKNKMSYKFVRGTTIPDNKLELFNYVDNSTKVMADGVSIKNTINILLNSAVISNYSPKKTYVNFTSKNTIISTNIQDAMTNFNKNDILNYKKNEILSYMPNNNYSFIEGMCPSQTVYNANPQNNLPNTAADLNNVSFYSKFITNVKRTDDLKQNLTNLQNN